MVGVFPKITIRVYVAIHLFIYLIFIIISKWIKIDVHLDYLLRNLILLSWFAWVVKCNAKVSEAYKDFTNKVMAGKKRLLLLVLFNILFAIGVVEILAYIFYQIAPETLKDYITYVQQSDKTSSIISAVCLYLNVCLVGPIVEEITYRGIIFNRLLTRCGFRIGLYASSFVFAVQHAEMVHAFVFGILMSLLYFKTNNIMVPITFHIINNSLVTMFEFIPDNGDEILFTSQDLFIGVVLFLPSLIYLVRYIKQNWPRENVKNVIVN